jgi:hypothetical protein
MGTGAHSDPAGKNVTTTTDGHGHDGPNPSPKAGADLP